VRIQSSGGLSEDAIQQMVRDAEAHAEKDKKRKEMIEVWGARRWWGCGLPPQRARALSCMSVRACVCPAVRHSRCVPAAGVVALGQETRWNGASVDCLDSSLCELCLGCSNHAFRMCYGSTCRVVSCNCPCS
jgi:hypothetical protein